MEQLGLNAALCRWVQLWSMVARVSRKHGPLSEILRSVSGAQSVSSHGRPCQWRLGGRPSSAATEQQWPAAGKAGEGASWGVYRSHYHKLGFPLWLGKLLTGGGIASPPGCANAHR